jgi:hypothetical protein
MVVRTNPVFRARSATLSFGCLASAAQQFPKVRRGRSQDLSLFEQGLFRNRLHKTPLCSRHRIGRKRRAFLTDCTRNGRQLDRADQLRIQAKPQRIAMVCLGFPLLSLCPWMNLLFCYSARRELPGGLVRSVPLLPCRSQCRCRGVSVVIRQTL